MRIKNIIKEKGFSLFELVLVLAILLIVLATVFSGFTGGLRTFRQERAKAERDTEIKRVLELMSIELAQAGVTPAINNEEDTVAARKSSPVTGAMATTGATSLTFNHTIGLYPYRPIILELPQDAANSEIVKVSNFASTTQINLISGTTKSHASGVSINSPSFPNMFGILNPPPALGTTTKVLQPQTTLAPVRLGFFGDILGNGTLYYVEYTYDYQQRVLGGVTNGFIGRLRRSISPIDNNLITTSAKNTANTILENVTDVRFTLVYPTNTQVPIAVRIEIEGETSAPTSRLGGTSYDLAKAANLFNRIRTRTEVYLRGTGSAANIIANQGEDQLRQMMPPCTATNTGFPPCTSWTGVAWWAVVRDNFAGKKFDNSATQALP